VYVLVVGAFFPRHAATVIFGLYTFGIIAAIASGKLFSSTFLAGMSKPFVMELPPYQRPTLRSILLHTWERGYIFIQKMGTVILVGSVIIWALGYFPRDIQLPRDYSSEKISIRNIHEKKTDEIHSLFSESVKKAETRYVSEMVSFSESEPYQLLTAQCDSLLSRNQMKLETALSELRFQETAEIMEQRWIGKIGKWIEPVVAPLGFSWREGVALVTGFVAKEIVVSTYGVLFGVGEKATEESSGVITRIRQSGMTPLVALGFLVFTLLYTPCLATVAAIKRETASWNYTLFSIAYSIALAWILAFALYQIGSVFGWLS